MSTMKKTEILKLRVTPKQKLLFMKNSELQGKSLSKWVIDILLNNTFK